MPKKQQDTVICQVCKEQKKISDVLSAEMVREPIVERIKTTHPDWSSQGFICIPDLNRFRTEYVEDVIKTDKGELSALEEQVVRSLTEQELLSKNINVEYDQQRTLGEQMADKLADFGGSWRFISIFCGALFLVNHLKIEQLCTFFPEFFNSHAA